MALRLALCCAMIVQQAHALMSARSRAADGRYVETGYGRRLRGAGDSVDVFLVRHGDKMSKYPECEAGQSVDRDLCYETERFGNNPELSPCGRRQALDVAGVLLERSPKIAAVVSSPFGRCLQTALPLASKAGANITVEPIISEDRQTNSPDHPRNSKPSAAGAEDWASIAERWDRGYAAPPIPTPEGNEEYWDRMDQASVVLKQHIERSKAKEGAVVFFSHGGPSFSLAYALCQNLFNNSLEAFVNSEVVGESGDLEGIAPTGIIHIVMHSSTGCVSIQRPDNQVYHATDCGKTKPHKTPYSEDPGKYARPPADTVASKVDRSGD